MYASVHDQPPSALLSHSIPSKFAASPTSGPTTKQPPSPALFNSSSIEHLCPTSFTLASSLPTTHALFLPQLSKSSSDNCTPSKKSSRRTVLNEPMQRSPYSRDTTDISDQDLRQILDSENISGLPAPYCLVPHYEPQPPLPQGAAMQDSSAFHSGNAGYGLACAQPSTAAALAEAAGENSRRRTRTTLTPYQLRVLFRVWERIQYPSSDLRSRLASNLMMTPRNVQIWFQNQRQKTKERAELRRRTHSPNMHATVIASMRTSSSHHGHIAQHQPLPAYQHHHVYSSPLAYPTGFGARESHPSAISMPGRSPPESPFRYTHGPPPAPPAVQTSPQYYEHSAAAAAFAGESMSMHRASEASSAYSMLTPPALYPYIFTQHPSSQQQQQQQRSPVIPPHTHHYAHARPSSSAPAPPHYLVSPSFLQDSSAQRQQHSSVQKYISLRAPEMSSERVQPARLSQHSGSSPIDIQDTIPSPATPIFSAEHMHNHSPMLLSSMSMLTMASPIVAASNSPRLPYEQPASRRTRLTDILNPIDHATENTAADNNSSSNSHLERLPSLGSVLAYVQSESADSSSAMNTTSMGSETNAAGTSLAAEKWRPW